jgi:ABC-type lipoprotein export system ATPase subunit
MSILFKIENLQCAYKNGRDVLTINSLAIPSNKLVILLGKSGSGKSTLLETLGLMNNTMKGGDIHFSPSPDKGTISFSQLWSQHQLARVAKVRHDHFSFIFQNTNLMPNFSAYENACLTNLIRGKSLAESSEKIKVLMNELGLEEISINRKASEMSGGQKQRLAFIRAISSGFDVLFGDEPTGNLDDFNSRELISFLKKNVVEFKRSAIIVTHNIQLSIDFGDVIILLNGNQREMAPSEIIQENIYHKQNEERIWTNCNQESLTDPEMFTRINDILGHKYTPMPISHLYEVEGN